MRPSPSQEARVPLPVVWRYVASGLLAAVPFSMMMPFAAVTLAEQGHEPAVVGLFATVPFLVVAVLTPLAPRLHAALGRGGAFRLGLAAGVGQALAFAATDGLAPWSLAALLGGVQLALLWGLTDGLLAENAPRDRVGRLTGLYQVLLAFALMLGPALPRLLGLDFHTAALLAVVFAAGAVVPVATLAPDVIRAGRPRARAVGLAPVLRRAPVLVAAALLGGLFETGLNAVGAVQALELGTAAATAASLVAVIAAGSLLVQLPLGWLADRIAPEPLLVGSGLLLLASGLLLPWTGGHPWLLWVLAAVWGAAGGGLYTLAMIRVATTFAGTAVPAATSAAILAYTLGAIGGPSLGGLAIQLSGSYGLAVFVAVPSAAFVVLAVRSWLRT